MRTLLTFPLVIAIISMIVTPAVIPEASPVSAMHERMSEYGFVVGPSYDYRDVKVSDDGKDWMIRNQSKNDVAFVVNPKYGRWATHGVVKAKKSVSLGVHDQIPEVNIGPVSSFHNGIKIYFEKGQWFVENLKSYTIFCEVHVANIEDVDNEKLTCSSRGIYSDVLHPQNPQPLQLHHEHSSSSLDPEAGPRLYDFNQLYLRSSVLTPDQLRPTINPSYQGSSGFVDYWKTTFHWLKPWL
ncbi:hypothetical protein PGT21_014522 [Puccinia graminis f. sp. tritici]|uniref:Uncharacterized protein n=1 Tax=Puccinia graminis f. sp. tritici TaxID=56615 RepID=A0A5B0QXV1_PUCGR|nr:hypothetical protein PGT21_014522 [Puccinia graminis f. sp. tritici]